MKTDDGLPIYADQREDHPPAAESDPLSSVEPADTPVAPKPPCGEGGSQETPMFIAPKPQSGEGGPPVLPEDFRTSQHAATMEKLMQYCGGNFTARDMADMLRLAKYTDGNDESVLHHQAQVLEICFNRLLVKAIDMKMVGGRPAPDYVDPRIMELAFRAQKQCRAAINARALLKFLKDKK